MRMIGIGLMGFLLAGVALLLSTMNILERGQRYVSELTDGPQLIFEGRKAVPAADDNTATIYRSNPSHPVILSGLPAYQGVAFNMPMDARPTSGYLQIDATLQALDRVKGVLRISIDNVKRGEILLRPGEVGRSLQISLSPTDFARDQLVVSFSLQGEGVSSPCSTDEGLEAVVEIETTSAVFLTLDRPLASVRDRVNAWGQLVRVGWPHWLTPEERTRRLILASQFKQRDVEVMMVDAHSADALTTMELRELLPQFATSEASHDETTLPRLLALKGANAGLRRFQRKSTWRTRFDLRNEKANWLPSALELRLILGRQFNGGRWALSVTLNSRLVHQELIDAGRTDVSTTIALPEDMQSAVNVIEVTAASSGSPEGRCGASPELIAEMLPETRLLVGKTQFSDALTELRLLLSNTGPLSIGAVSSLTAVDAEAAGDILAQLIPADVVLKPNHKQAQIIVLPINGADILLPKTTPIWLVTRNPITQELGVQSLEGSTELPRTGATILVTTNAIDLPGAAS
ncbi:MAG: hypothetical protein ABJI96_00575 [Paracoccaceae bacterium]